MNMRVEQGGRITALLAKLAVCAESSEGSGTNGERLHALRDIRHCMRASPELTVTLWQGLLDGDWALVMHADHGEQRLLLARQNLRDTGVSQALTARERAAAKLALLGRSTKYVAYELKVSLSSASTLVASAIKKLGLRSRVELTEIFGLTRGTLPGDLCAHRFDAEGELYVLFQAPLRKLQPPGCLTEAEREVVLGVLSKQSNAEIARARQTSINTVANQLRTVYSKLGISGRFELICAC